MKINLGEVLSKAWQVTWKFKVLWIFGILAGCGGANGSRSNFNYNGSGWREDSGRLPDFFRRFETMRPDLAVQEILNRYGAIIAIVILLLCVLWLVFYFLGVMGKTGLIKGVSKADAGAGALKFGELWSESMPYFWRIFGLNLLVGLPFLILIIVMIAGLGYAGFTTYQGGQSGAGIGALIVVVLGVFFSLLCVISILMIVIGMIVEQAQNAIVLENLGILEGLRRGWGVFKSAVLTIIAVAIVNGLIGAVAGLLMALPMIVVAVPAGIAMIAGTERSMIIPLVIMGGCFLLYLPVLLTFSGILVTYTQSIWTLVYRRLTAQPVPMIVETSTGA